MSPELSRAARTRLAKGTQSELEQDQGSSVNEF